MERSKQTRKREQVYLLSVSGFLVLSSERPGSLLPNRRYSHFLTWCWLWLCKKTNRRHAESVMIKKCFCQTCDDLFWHIVFGKDGEFVFLVDDYRYTMTHSWGWILSVRDFPDHWIQLTPKDRVLKSPDCPHVVRFALVYSSHRCGFG